MAEKRTRRRGFLASREGLALLEAERREKGYIGETIGETYELLAEAAGLNADDQVKRLFNPHWGLGIEKNAIEKIAKVLDLNPKDFIDDWLPTKNLRQPKTKINLHSLNWWDISSLMWEHQQKQQQIRRKATEMGFEVKVYVPLGLVERKQQQRRSGIIETEQIHQLDPEVITRIYKHQEFLDNIIGQKPTDQDQHIAIIGEPGAGKTTLLDRIATYIKDKNQDLFICISLANLQGRSIKTYILNEWLPQAIALSYPELDPESLEKTFQHRLNQGGVWLLLDGADEGKLSLAEIQTELSNFVKIRVVLTCRTNVWDNYVNNPLIGFKTYKTQNFEPEEIDQFIQDWFEQAKDKIRGKELQAKLKEPQRDRIRQLVTNPLRLALLCQIFYKDKNAELPETKAGLYEQFVRYFYEWKPAIVGINWGTQPQLQDKLHQGLGKLAIAGLDSNYRYRLPLSLIKTEMDDKLFKLAWDLGWLTLVDREEKTDEVVYAFYHPTFQEYFAALAVDDWRKEFLNHVPHNPKLGIYRIFQPQWKQVILFWFGKKEISISQKEDFIISQKEDFIKNLINFNDQCQSNFFGGCGFYNYKAYFLAFEAIGEFNSCYTNKIFDQVLYWAFGYFNKDEKQQQIDVFPEIFLAAKKTFLETHQILGIEKLVNLLQTPDVPTCIEVANILGKIVPNHPQAIETLLHIINSSLIPIYRMRSVIALSNICNDKQQKIEYMVELCNHSCPLVRSIAIGNIEPEHPQASTPVIIEIEKSPIVKPLTSLQEIEYWFNNLRLSKNISEKESVIEQLGNIISNAPQELCLIIEDIIYELVSIMNSTSEEHYVFWKSDLSLSKLAKSNPVIFVRKLSLIINNRHDLFKDDNLKHKERYYKLLWQCSELLSYHDFDTAWHSQLNINKKGSYDLTEILKQLQPNDKKSPLKIDDQFNVQVILIDNSNFIDPDNPALDIYVQMVKQNCPKCSESRPKTMQELKAYWQLDVNIEDKLLFLLFYSEAKNGELQGWSDRFLQDLDKFEGNIGIIVSEPINSLNLRSFWAKDSQLIENILGWIRSIILEQ